jgi:hypothetical protein
MPENPQPQKKSSRSFYLRLLSHERMSNHEPTDFLQFQRESPLMRSAFRKPVRVRFERSPDATTPAQSKQKWSTTEPLENE